VFYALRLDSQDLLFILFYFLGNDDLTTNANVQFIILFHIFFIFRV